MGIQHITIPASAIPIPACSFGLDLISFKATRPITSPIIPKNKLNNGTQNNKPSIREANDLVLSFCCINFVFKRYL